MKYLYMFTAPAVLIACFLGVHLYSASWIARAFSFTPVQSATIRFLFVLAAVMSFAIIPAQHFFSSGIVRFLCFAGYSWMGTVCVVFSVFLCSDAFRLIAGRFFQPGQWYVWLTLALAVSAVFSAFYGGSRLPDVKNISLGIKNLPPELRGMRIAQVSDTHIDSYYKAERFFRIVSMLEEIKPDTVIISGDFVDRGLDCSGAYDISFFKNLSTKYGIFGALGNHEYYSGLKWAEKCYAAAGVKLLRNGSADIGALRITGLDDIRTGRIDKDGLRNIVGKRKGAVEIVVSHQPLYYSELAEAGAALVLSGHTHKGQIFPFHLMVRAAYKYFYGLYKIKDTYFYVSAGAGTWGPLMRFFSAPEITVIKLDGI